MDRVKPVKAAIIQSKVTGVEIMGAAFEMER